MHFVFKNASIHRSYASAFAQEDITQANADRFVEWSAERCAAELREVHRTRDRLAEGVSWVWAQGQLQVRQEERERAATVVLGRSAHTQTDALAVARPYSPYFGQHSRTHSRGSRAAHGPEGPAGVDIGGGVGAGVDEHRHWRRLDSRFSDYSK